MSIRFEGFLVVLLGLFVSAWGVGISTTDAYGGTAIDLTGATIVVRPGELPNAEKMAADLLSKEIEKRTGKPSAISTEWPEGKGTVIAVTTQPDLPVWGRVVPRRMATDLPERQPEGYWVHSESKEGEQPVVWIVGADSRGAMYGAGYVLHTMDWDGATTSIESGLQVASAPEHPIRGHQLGYRARANSWDEWTPEEFETYIRELIVYGVNAIENIPFQDSDPSPHMKVTRDEMNKVLSEICAKYELEYWIWAPAEFPLEKETERKAFLVEQEAFFKDMPRLDGVFFPGGDPGDNHPKYVLPYLKEVAEILAHYHPEAGVWLSLQQYDEEEVRYSFEYIQREQPTWLRGLVAGPSSPPMSLLREHLPEQYKLRDYPDITHTVRAQHPIPWWDTAFCLTIGREPVNPRPVAYQRIIHAELPYTDGFISYSDGMHDNLNKVVWSLLAWDSAMDIRDAVLDYTRFFFGSAAAEQAADGVFALEANNNGGLAENGSVDGTLALWQGLEREHPQLAEHWRWQTFLYRAYYDAFVRHRLIHEQKLEREASAVLGRTKELGAEKALEEALAILARAESERPRPELRERVFELADAMFESIGFQTSIEKYGASGAERGANLDFIDIPLNNRWWLEDEFTKIRAMKTDDEKHARLAVLAAWENPGPGSFYDDVGNIGKSQHVIRGEDPNTDPLCTRNPAPGFMWWDNGSSRKRISWPSYMDWPLGMRYDALDRKAKYTIRLTGQGQSKLRIDGELVEPSVFSPEIGEFKEFPVPAEALKDGSIVLTWDKLDESHLNWRQQSHVAEVWLLKQ